MEWWRFRNSVQFVVMLFFLIFIWDGRYLHCMHHNTLQPSTVINSSHFAPTSDLWAVMCPQKLDIFNEKIDGFHEGRLSLIPKWIKFQLEPRNIRMVMSSVVSEVQSLAWDKKGKFKHSFKFQIESERLPSLLANFLIDFQFTDGTVLSIRILFSERLKLIVSTPQQMPELSRVSREMNKFTFSCLHIKVCSFSSLAIGIVSLSTCT